MIAIDKLTYAIQKYSINVDKLFHKFDKFQKNDLNEE